MSCIYDLSVEVAAQLRARKFPSQVHYGLMPTQRHDFQSLILFDRDHDAGEPIVEPLGANQRNPEAPFNRLVAGVVHAYARASKPGAAKQHHEAECDRICDGVLSALYRVTRARKLPLQIAESRVLSAEDLKATMRVVETWPGVVTRIRFTLRTLVRDVDYKGDAATEAEVFAVHAPVVESPGYPDYNPVDEDP